ncbi:MAG: hypothetical protein ABI082_05365 [Dokdonella sp.]
MKRPDTDSKRSGDWYRQPVVWLGLLLFAASLAGCVWMIVLGARHADTPVPTAGGEVFRVPLAHPKAPTDPPRTAQ